MKPSILKLRYCIIFILIFFVTHYSTAQTNDSGEALEKKVAYYTEKLEAADSRKDYNHAIIYADSLIQLGNGNLKNLSRFNKLLYDYDKFTECKKLTKGIVEMFPEYDEINNGMIYAKMGLNDSAFYYYLSVFKKTMNNYTSPAESTVFNGIYGINELAESIEGVIQFDTAQNYVTIDHGEYFAQCAYYYLKEKKYYTAFAQYLYAQETKLNWLSDYNAAVLLTNLNFPVYLNEAKELFNYALLIAPKDTGTVRLFENAKKYLQANKTIPVSMIERKIFDAYMAENNFETRIQEKQRLKKEEEAAERKRQEEVAAAEIRRQGEIEDAKNKSASYVEVLEKLDSELDDVLTEARKFKDSWDKYTNYGSKNWNTLNATNIISNLMSKYSAAKDVYYKMINTVKSANYSDDFKAQKLINSYNQNIKDLTTAITKAEWWSKLHDAKDPYERNPF